MYRVILSCLAVTLFAQPAVGQQVQRRIGRPHLHGAECVPPVRMHRGERLPRSGAAAVALHQLAGLVRAAAHAEAEDDLARLPGCQLDHHLDRIARVERGVYVTRFHYVNVEDPITATLTGMTRDGTFVIENGELAYPVKNQRFTQSAVDTLAHVGGLSAERWHVGEADDAGGGGALVPYALLERFAFTGQTG